MAKSIKQQTAIAMSMKKAGKKPKSQGQKDVKKFKTGGKVKKLKKFNVGGVNDCPPGMFKDAFGNCVSANQLKIMENVRNQQAAADAYNRSIMNDYIYNRDADYIYNRSRTNNRANLDPAEYIKPTQRKLYEKSQEDILKNMYKKFDQKKFDELIARKKGGSTYKKGGAVKKFIKSKKK